MRMFAIQVEFVVEAASEEEARAIMTGAIEKMDNDSSFLPDTILPQDIISISETDTVKL